MRLTFWGVRGSIPTPGPLTARWGGNSSCLCVEADSAPPLVLDCGTGARLLGEHLLQAAHADPSRPREVWLLFTHLHADHIFGFPFFAPLYSPSWRVSVGIPAWSEDEAREKLGRYVNGTFFPLRLHELPGPVSFHPVAAQHRWDAGPWEVEGVRLAHPGGAMGYRVAWPSGASGGASPAMAYLSDTGPLAPLGEGVAAGAPPTPGEERVLRLLRGCGVVVFDTMYDFDAYLTRMHFGHAYPEYAIALCRAAGVGTLVLFHHAPDATDADLDARAARYAEVDGLRVIVAREGDTIDVKASGARSS